MFGDDVVALACDLAAAIHPATCQEKFSTYKIRTNNDMTLPCCLYMPTSPNSFPSMNEPLGVCGRSGDHPIER